MSLHLFKKLFPFNEFVKRIETPLLSKNSGYIFLHPQKSPIIISAFVLKFLSLLCPFIYLQMVLSGILNGLGKQIFVFRNNLIASGINLFFIYFFIPYKGIIAFIFGWLASLIVACLLDLNVITKTIDIKLKFDELILKPFLQLCFYQC